MGTESLSRLVAARRAELSYYSPYYFLRQLPIEQQQNLFGTGAATRWEQEAGTEVVAAASGDVQWLLQHLTWDSGYFNAPMYRLFTALFDGLTSPAQLVQAATELRQQLAARHGAAYYAFSVVPAEDIRLLQALTGAGWQLVETRLTYYRDQLPAFDYPRYPVRPAALGEAALVGQVAATARNAYDRFHADSWFGTARADAYLARYAENTVAAGLADVVLVPDQPDLPVDSFLAISDLAHDAQALGTALSRVLLTAVGPANRGWHVKLMAETVRRAQAAGHEAVLMTTQATNHAVFRSCEKLGFRLGATSHVLACNGLVH
ncbi:dTDP-4-amino-4,6-dideoxy-D-galactose acyltransferase [Hymenobacter sp. UYAg731]